MSKSWNLNIYAKKGSNKDEILKIINSNVNSK